MSSMGHPVLSLGGVGISLGGGDPGMWSQSSVHSLALKEKKRP
jgi:hypothetical protein